MRNIKSHFKNDILLLQIDGSNESIYNGEQNVYLHLFIDKEDLKNRNFSQVYVDWEVSD